MEGRERNIQNYMITVKCISMGGGGIKKNKMHFIYSKYPSVTLLKLKTFKIWTMIKKYINVNFAYKFYFIYY